MAAVNQPNLNVAAGMNIAPTSNSVDSGDEAAGLLRPLSAAAGTNNNSNTNSLPTPQQPTIRQSLSIEIPASAVAAVTHTPTNAILRLAVTTFWEEIWVSTELLFQSKLTWLLLMGPIAVIGDSTGWIGEATCFTCAGLALIPCAER